MFTINKVPLCLLPLAPFISLLISCESLEPNQVVQNSIYRYDVMPEIDPPNFSPKKTYGVVVTAYDRPEYLKQTLNSLRNSDLSEAVIVIVDDESSDMETKSLLKDFELGSVPLYKFRHRKNSGVLTGLLHGFKFLALNVEYIVNIDADVLVNRDWLKRLRATYEKIGKRDIVLSGFNTKNHVPKNCTDDWCEKDSIGGVNFFMHNEFYRQHLATWFSHANRLAPDVWKKWDSHVVDKMKEGGFGFYVTTPSVIQHIGFKGVNSGFWVGADVADDFIGE